MGFFVYEERGRDILSRIKNKNKSIGKKVFLSLLLVAVIIFAGDFYSYDRYLGDMNKVDISRDEEILHINRKSSDENSHITNYALFGIDNRSDGYDEASRSDTIIIATLE